MGRIHLKSSQAVDAWGTLHPGYLGALSDVPDSHPCPEMEPQQLGGAGLGSQGMLTPAGDGAAPTAPGRAALAVLSVLPDPLPLSRPLAL